MSHAVPRYPLDLSAHFSRFRATHEDRLHFAAHSHHFWPDATREAHLACWDHAAEHSDEKWEHVLGAVWREVADGIARHLSLPDAATLVPAPNTHELVSRLLSCLPPDRPARVLTTDGEFHSFRRQCARLEEEGLVEVTRVAAEPAGTLLQRLAAACAGESAFDLVFVSQVLFNSGIVIEHLGALVDAVWRPGRLVVIDGYHGFLARPTDLAPVAERAFYLAGGYKYAMAGEGACFMHCPPGVAMRPRNTGWYAGFGALGEQQSGVPYAEDGWRFMGSTFDPSGLFRLRASLAWLRTVEVDAHDVHAHAGALQRQLVDGLAGRILGPFDATTLVVPVDDPAIGNFLTFRCPDAGEWTRRLREHGIVVDHRADRLRVGFGLYQTAEDVARLLSRLEAVAGA